LKNYPRVKVGDTIRVVLEGVVTYTEHDCYIELEKKHLAWLNNDEVTQVEIIRQSAKVGDKLSTVEELDALPLGSVVLRGTGYYPAYKTGEGWLYSGKKTFFSSQDILGTNNHYTVTVLHLP
jgi:hypothetical protein